MCGLRLVLGPWPGSLIFWGLLSRTPANAFPSGVSSVTPGQFDHTVLPLCSEYTRRELICTTCGLIMSEGNSVVIEERDVKILFKYKTVYIFRLHLLEGARRVVLSCSHEVTEIVL